MTTLKIVTETMKAVSSILDDKFKAFTQQFTEKNTTVIRKAVKKAEKDHL